MNRRDREVLGTVYEALNAISAAPSGGTASSTVAALAGYASRAEKVVSSCMLALSEMQFGDPDGSALGWAEDARAAALSRLDGAT